MKRKMEGTPLAPSNRQYLTYWLRKLSKYSAMLNATMEDFREAEKTVTQLVVKVIEEDNLKIATLEAKVKELEKLIPKKKVNK